MDTNFRYHPARGLRVKGKPYGAVDAMEIHSEDYGTIEDFIEAIQEVNEAAIEQLNEKNWEHE